jgi:hypothetical protein
MLNIAKNTVKRIMAISPIRRAVFTGTRVALEIFASCRLLATLYSLMAFGTFNRKQYDVLTGRREYYRNLIRSRCHFGGLRRNIHRLEKGLCMRPRRDIFGQDYIGETVDFYALALAGIRNDPESFDATEIQWAHDVLRTYFTQCGSAALVDHARARPCPAKGGAPA